jgi:hypothetical protein
MANIVESSPTIGEDQAPIERFPWLTPRNLTLFIIGWLTLFAIGSFFLANPFQSEPHAGVEPSYHNVMYLHGLLIGMVGLLGCVTMLVLKLCGRHLQLWMTGGVLFATILSAVGGIFDTKIPGAEVPMWTQIISFFALDEILIVMILALYSAWRSGLPTVRSLAGIAAFFATVSMLIAAVMGHISGWIMEFGWGVPSFLRSFGQFAGFGTGTDLAVALRTSHSHEMVVGVMALIAVVAGVQFGVQQLRDAAQILARISLGMIALGTVAMTAVYIAAGISQWAPPTYFQSAGGTNGIASDDLVTGIFVMGGGLLLAIALVVGRYGTPQIAILGRPVRLAALWSWVLSFASVVIAGYAIELNEVRFGAGDQTASAAANDGIFTWLHQDIGLFLLPTLVLVMVVVERLVPKGQSSLIGWGTMIGTTIAFVGGLIWVFVNPALHGSGYIISTVGLVVVGGALLATMWGARLPVVAPSPTVSVVTPKPPAGPVTAPPDAIASVEEKRPLTPITR